MELKNETAGFAYDRVKVDAELMEQFVRERCSPGLNSINKDVHLSGDVFAQVDTSYDPPRYYWLTNQPFFSMNSRYGDSRIPRIPNEYSIQIDIYSYINWLENKIQIRNHKKKI